ncbi:hypothetical protein QCA50_005178 [Cerrena zonata]|uniref:Uncharacterized protein n=1 Tax=Cerrena zonata TaxID=2478898 RepID=A0AAW0GKZ5_9APHY
MSHHHSHPPITRYSSLLHAITFFGRNTLCVWDINFLCEIVRNLQSLLCRGPSPIDSLGVQFKLERPHAAMFVRAPIEGCLFSELLTHGTTTSPRPSLNSSPVNLT